jgi:heme/copper-type cytochrome/quinol oxidase subunit 2
MSYLRRFGRRAAAGLTLLVGWLAATAAWAQVKPPAKDDNAGTTASGAYVWGYMLFILGIVLGLLVVCRSANRRDRARPEEYAESTLSEQSGPSRTK